MDKLAYGPSDKGSAYNAGDMSSTPRSGDPLEKEMATHSSILSWKNPWIEKSHELQFIGLQRVRHDFRPSVWKTANWKILREMKIPYHLNCLLRNFYANQEAIVRTRCGIMDWFKIAKGVSQGCVLSPCLFNFYAAYIMHNAEVPESLESRLLGEISTTSDTQVIPV